MKKIKLPLEMANGVMVRSLDELKENWDLEKIVGYFGDGRLVTWLNDRYYTDLAERVQKITAIGAEAQKQLCAVFGMEFKQDEVVDAEAVAERKRKLDILRQFTSDDEILKNVDSVAFDQEDLKDLLRKGVDRIYLFKNKFSVPTNIKNKHYVGLGDVEVTISSKEYINFGELGVIFENVRFDAEYQEIVKKFSKKVGDIIKLGEWHSNPIEWQILEIRDGEALLLSKYALACKKYHKNVAITWENCDLRKWLNGEFFQTAFNGDAARSILERHVSAHYNSIHKVDSGNDTQDKVFLLSIKEATEYFRADEERACVSLFFVKNEVYISDSRACQWYLRSCGYNANYVATVNADGSVNSFGECVCSKNCGVRPVMWVDLSKL